MTSALPQVVVVAVGALTEGAAGRYDTAVADLDDGRRVVVRVPVDEQSSTELAAQARALHALTPGVRSLLPFRAPELLGETSLGGRRVLVVDLLEGYRVEAAHVPAGRGAATAIGGALAALHALPLSIVRTEGLPVRTPSQAQDEVVRLVDRVESTRRAPAAILTRWRRALAAEELWRFESAVTLGGATATSFLFTDVDDEPTVTGVLEWHGLQVGDPAVDLQWLAAAPDAADDVFESYASASGRAPDALVRERARLYAELEFARWLVHGWETGRDDVVDDAVNLLESLAASVSDDVVPRSGSSVDEALALLDRTPEAPAAEVDTSMHTDTYDPEELSAWIAAEQDDAGRATTDLTDAAAQATGDLREAVFDQGPAPEPVAPPRAGVFDEPVSTDEGAAHAAQPTATEDAVPVTRREARAATPLWSDITFAETAPLPDEDLPPRVPRAPITAAELPGRGGAISSFGLDAAPAGSDAARRAATRTAHGDADGRDDAAEAQRASDAALRRWLAD